MKKCTICLTSLHYYLKYIKEVNGLKYNYGCQMRRLRAGCQIIGTGKLPQIAPDCRRLLQNAVQVENGGK